MSALPFNPASLHVLVVDDHDPMRKGIHRILTHMGFEQVTECFDGFDAIEALERGAYDLVVCDLFMRRIGGIQLLRHVRGRDIGSEVPFIMVSGEASTEEIVRCVDIGANDYLLKPFQIQDLEKKVEKVLTAALSPTPVDKLLREGEREYLRGNLEQALKIVQTARVMDETSARARHLEAVMLDKASKTIEAMKALSDNIERAPAYFRNYATLANIQLRLGLQPDAVASLRRELGYNPRQPERQHLLGTLFVKEGAFDEAIACFREALKEDQRNKDFLISMAGAYADSGNVEKAIGLFKRVRRFHPDCTEALEAIVRVYTNANEPRRAVLALKDERNANPNRSDTYQVLARLLIKNGEDEEAGSVLRELLKRQPEHIAALRDLANLQLRTQQWEPAVETLTKICHLEPTKASCLALGELLQNLGQNGASAKYFYRALCMDHNESRAFAGLGVAHQVGNQTAKAYLLFVRALAGGPREAKLVERYNDCRQELLSRRGRSSKVAS